MIPAATSASTAASSSGSVSWPPQRARNASQAPAKHFFFSHISCPNFSKNLSRHSGSRVIPVDVRIIAATNKDLLQETVEGRFREDLYYRLDVLDLKLPPLRERGDDVKILGLHLFRQLPGGKDPIMQSQFLYLLEQAGPYQWYGNIRELQNFVERANILMRNAGASSVTVSDILRRRAEPAPEPCQETESRDRRAIEAALHNHPGSMADAARSLGCSRQTLWRKMKKYGIQR